MACSMSASMTMSICPHAHMPTIWQQQTLSVNDAVVVTLADSHLVLTSLFSGKVLWAKSFQEVYRPLSISCDSKTENINVIAQTLSSSGDGAEKNVLLEIDVSQHTIKEFSSSLVGNQCAILQLTVACVDKDTSNSQQISMSYAPLKDRKPIRFVSYSEGDIMSIQNSSSAGLIYFSKFRPKFKSLASGTRVFLQRSPSGVVAQTASVKDGKAAINDNISHRNLRADISNLYKSDGRISFVHCSQKHKRCLVTFEDYTMISITHESSVSWIRDESLTDIIASKFIDLPPAHDEESIFEENNAFTRFSRRIALTLRDLSETFLLSSRFEDGNTKGDLTQDYFNTNQLVIVVTRNGRLLALDSTTGQVVWRHLSTPRAPIYTAKLIELRSTAHRHGVVALIATVEGDGSFIFFFDPITGTLVGDFALPDTSAAGVVDLRSKALHACTVPHVQTEDHSHILAVLTADFTVHTFPRTEHAASQLMARNVPFFVHVVDPSTGILSGYRLAFDFDHTGIAEQVWRVEINPEQERIVAYTQPDRDPAASLGQVLSDKAVLYKYLNPNLIAFATLSPYVKKSAVMTVYLLDTVKGTFIERLQLEGVRGPVHLCMSENWLLYGYRNRKSKRHELSMIEMFDSTNKLKENGERFSSLSDYKPIIMKQSYILPSAITTMSVTRTEMGIAEKKVLIGLASGGIFAINKKWLDARRPATPKAQERILDLPKYEPLVQINPVNIMTYHKRIERLNRIVTSPSGLESTSLVLAYGLDMFFTRMTPSGKFDSLDQSFNRPALLGTLALLIAGTYLLSKFSAKKVVDKAWQ
eukprot:gene383-3731_t